MKKWKLWSGLFLVFLSGLIIGSVSTGLYIKQRIEGVIQGGPPAVKKVVVKRLTDELKLTKDQQTEIEKIVSEAQSRLLKLRMQHQPEIEEIFDNSIALMKTKLSHDQQGKIDMLYGQTRKTWRIPEQ